MPSRKTEATELSLAFGLLGIDDIRGVDPDSAIPRFNGTLTLEKFHEFIDEFNTNVRNQLLYREMHQVGLRLREDEPALSRTEYLDWLGPYQQARTATMARDIQAGYVQISVKADSDVVANLSPYNLLHALPAGEQPGSRSDNWYRAIAPTEYQALYDVAGQIAGVSGLPDKVFDYDTNTTGATRRSVARLLRTNLQAGGSDADIFQSKYLEMSHTVSERSAHRFNSNLSKSLSSGSRTAVQERIAQTFLRLDSVPYILAGRDRGHTFAVRLPDITLWRRNWSFTVKAVPDLEAGQPIVRFDFQTKSREGSLDNAPFHTQIRWSHGKFCGNPEGKLYKDFRWVELPYLTVLFEG